MERKITIAEFRWTISRLPSDEPQENPRVWYKTQKEHWLGWLRDYHGPGAYGRQTGQNRDARFAYNHIVCPDMLLYLIRTIPLRPELIAAAEKASQNGSTLMEKAGAIRKVVPWSEIYQALWGEKGHSWQDRRWEWTDAIERKSKS